MDSTLIIFFSVLALIIIGIIWQTRNYYKSSAIAEDTDSITPSDESEGTAETVPEPTPLEMMKQVLENIGCRPQISEDNQLYVAFQGENFLINVDEKWINVLDPQWTSIDEDSPMVPALKEIINLVNFDAGPTVLFCPPNEEGKIAVMSRYDLPFVKDIPDKEGYITFILESFFTKKQKIFWEYENVIKNLKQGSDIPNRLASMN